MTLTKANFAESLFEELDEAAIAEKSPGTD